MYYLMGPWMPQSVLLLIVAQAAVTSAARRTPSLSRNYEESHENMVSRINSASSTWTAGYNEYFAGKTMQQIQRLMGMKILSKRELREKQINNPESLSSSAEAFDEAQSATGDDVSDLPDSFDAREQWPTCPTVKQIRDQGDCGSCWVRASNLFRQSTTHLPVNKYEPRELWEWTNDRAVAAASVISDRTCIQSNGKTTAELSAENLIACCWFCGMGCYGGFPFFAMFYWWFSGLVTGGNYGSHQGCQPYEMPPLNSHNNSEYVQKRLTTKFHFNMCHWKCEPGYNVTYSHDKHRARSFYWLFGGEAKIRRDIQANGPAEAGFTVYEDFLHYKTGVYQHVSGGVLGGHAVRVLGWGTENDTPYWLVANSWNTTWGENGFFKIRRGNNECGFETQMVAGIAKN